MKKFFTHMLLAAMLLAAGTLGAKDVELRGMLRSFTGVGIFDTDIFKNEQTVDFTLEGWGDMTRLVVNPYAYVGVDTAPELGIREAYVDIYFDDADIRVGKQAVLWGQAEGAFITDIVSPRDMRSFILADFREIRKGIPAIKADYYAGSYTFEGIWIPQFVPSSMPPEDSIWMRHMPFTPPMGTTVTMNAPDEPSPTLEHSEVFGKIRYFGPRVSWEVMGGYAWNDEPHIESMSAGPTVNQTYGRYTVVGGSFSTTIGDAVLRGETAAYLDKPFTVMTGAFPSVSITVEDHHQLQALAGLDWSLWGMEMSGQYILSYIHDYTVGMIDQGKMSNETSHTVTFRVQDTYFDDRLTAKLFSYIELDPLNALIRPSLSWYVEDGVLLEGGFEIFLGDEEGTFGAYRDNTMGYVSLRWYF
jgi:hypothetical protein